MLNFFKKNQKHKHEKDNSRVIQTKIEQINTDEYKPSKQNNGKGRIKVCFIFLI